MSKTDSVWHLISWKVYQKIKRCVTNFVFPFPISLFGGNCQDIVTLHSMNSTCIIHSKPSFWPIAKFLPRQSLFELITFLINCASSVLTAVLFFGCVFRVQGLWTVIIHLRNWKLSEWVWSTESLSLLFYSFYWPQWGFVEPLSTYFVVYFLLIFCKEHFMKFVKNCCLLPLL